MLRILILFFFSVVSSWGTEGEVPKAELPPGSVRVVAVLYDYTADLSRPSIVHDGKIHPGIIERYSKVLPEGDIAILLDSLSEKHPQSSRLLCDFAPHHAFLFYDKSDAIVGSVSICFSCRELQSPNFRRSRSEFYSYWNWRALKGIFDRNRIPIFSDQNKYKELRTK